MIRLSKTIRYVPKCGGNDKDANPAVVTYRALTAVEFEDVIKNQPTNIGLFKDRVISVEGILDEDGKAVAVEDIPDLGNSTALINDVVNEIFSSATMRREGSDLKNE